jgi:hypothetical protein
MSTVEEKRLQRLRFMQRLYDAVDGEPTELADMYEVGQAAGISKDAVFNVADYLASEGLVEFVATDGGIGITHRGRKEVEAAIEAPNKPTEHFPPINFINIGTMTNSTIQQATSASSQHVAISSTDVPALKSFLDVLHDHDHHLDELGGERAAEARAEIATLRAQIASPKPKREIVKASLHTLKEIIVHGFGHVTGHALLVEVLPKLAGLLAPLS